MREYPPMAEYKELSERLQGVAATRVAALSGHPDVVVGWVKNQTRMVTPQQLTDIREALDRMERDCKTCRHSIGYVGDVKIGIVKAQDYRNQGYSVGGGHFEEGYGIVCERHKTISPTPCRDWERECGSDD